MGSNSPRPRCLPHAQFTQPQCAKATLSHYREGTHVVPRLHAGLLCGNVKSQLYIPSPLPVSPEEVVSPTAASSHRTHHNDGNVLDTFAILIWSPLVPCAIAHLTGVSPETEELDFLNFECNQFAPKSHRGLEATMGTTYRDCLMCLLFKYLVPHFFSFKCQQS